MASKKEPKEPKKPTQAVIDKEMGRAASDYNELVHALHKQCLWNLASRLKMAPEELEEQWAEMT